MSGFFCQLQPPPPLPNPQQQLQGRRHPRKSPSCLLRLCLNQPYPRPRCLPSCLSSQQQNQQPRARQQLKQPNAQNLICPIVLTSNFPLLSPKYRQSPSRRHPSHLPTAPARRNRPER